MLCKVRRSRLNESGRALLGECEGAGSDKRAFGASLEAHANPAHQRQQQIARLGKFESENRSQRSVVDRRPTCVPFISSSARCQVTHLFALPHLARALLAQSFIYINTSVSKDLSPRLEE
jgi:hypothetical protein